MSISWFYILLWIPFLVKICIYRFPTHWTYFEHTRTQSSLKAIFVSQLACTQIRRYLQLGQSASVTKHPLPFGAGWGHSKPPMRVKTGSCWCYCSAWGTSTAVTRLYNIQLPTPCKTVIVRGSWHIFGGKKKAKINPNKTEHFGIHLHLLSHIS